MARDFQEKTEGRMTSRRVERSAMMMIISYVQECTVRTGMPQNSRMKRKMRAGRE